VSSRDRQPGRDVAGLGDGNRSITPPCGVDSWRPQRSYARDHTATRTSAFSAGAGHVAACRCAGVRSIRPARHRLRPERSGARRHRRARCRSSKYRAEPLSGGALREQRPSVSLRIPRDISRARHSSSPSRGHGRRVVSEYKLRSLLDMFEERAAQSGFPNRRSHPTPCSGHTCSPRAPRFGEGDTPGSSRIVGADFSRRATPSA